MHLRIFRILRAAIGLAVFAAFLGAGAATTQPLPPREAKFAYDSAIGAAAKDRDAALARADDAYADQVRVARAAYVAQLGTALDAAMTRKDLDDANHIKTLIDAVKEETDVSVSPAIKPGRVYLSDLEASDVKVADEWFGKKGVARGDVKITVNGKYSPNGICTHPPSDGYARVVFNLNGRYRSFTTQVGLNDSNAGNRTTPVTFVVLGDKRELWRSDPVSGWRTLQNCTADVRGVKTLELRVECPGSYLMAHAVWIEPVLMR